MSVRLPTESTTNLSTSSHLVERLKAQEPQAWQRLVEVYGPLVYAWCRRGGLSATDAADVMQEVFRSVFTGIGGFRKSQPGDSFRGWLRVVCRHRICDHFRARAGQAEAAGGTSAQRELQELPDPALDNGDPDDVASELGPGATHRAADLIRAEFEERTWQAFWRVTVAQQSAVDVAAELGLSPGAVRQAKYKVLKRLREELAE